MLLAIAFDGQNSTIDLVLFCKDTVYYVYWKFTTFTGNKNEKHVVTASRNCGGKYAHWQEERSLCIGTLNVFKERKYPF